MNKRKNNRLGKAGITFYAYATERIREKRLAGKHNTADLYRTTRIPPSGINDDPESPSCHPARTGGSTCRCWTGR